MRTCLSCILVLKFILLLLVDIASSWERSFLSHPRTTRLFATKNAVQQSQHLLHLPSGKSVRIRPRCVHIRDGWNITVWEWHRPANVVEEYWHLQQQQQQQESSSFRPDTNNDNRLLDPFGLVSWPGALVAARELESRRRHEESIIRDKVVVVLGAGPGVEALAAAQLGARRVLATDIHPATLELLRYGSERAGLQHIVVGQKLDLFSEEDPIPECDVLIAADVLYNPALAAQVGRRCQEALLRNESVKILVTDSQRIYGTDFLPALNVFLVNECKMPAVAWEERSVVNFTGSGVLVDEDQTYNVTARVLLIGW